MNQKETIKEFFNAIKASVDTHPIGSKAIEKQAYLNYDILNKMMLKSNEFGDKHFSSYLSEKTEELREQFRKGTFKIVDLNKFIQGYLLTKVEASK